MVTAIETWPSELPRPERSTWQRTSQEVRRQRTPEAGAPSYRRRFSAAALPVTLSVVLTRHLKAVFDRFYGETCRGGVVLFWMPDPTTEGWPMLTTDGTPVLAPDGRPVLLAKKWLCTWGETIPVETIEGQVEFRMTFDVIVVPS